MKMSWTLDENKHDIEGTGGVMHFKLLKTVKLYCKFVLNAVCVNDIETLGQDYLKTCIQHA